MIKQIQILQVNEKAENSRFIMFSGLEMLKTLGLTLSHDTYKQVYEGQHVTSSEDVNDILDELFADFNIRKPKEFKGHSLSTSDMVKMDGKYYYCDDYGLAEMKLKYTDNGWSYIKA